MDATEDTQEPKHHENNQDQAKNAAEARPAIAIVTIVAAAAAQQQNYQDDDQNRAHYSPSLQSPVLAICRCGRDNHIDIRSTSSRVIVAAHESPRTTKLYNRTGDDQLKTWRGGPEAGKPKLPPTAKELVEHGLMRLDTEGRHGWFFTEAGLARLRAMIADRRFADPEKFAHVHQELRLDPASEGTRPSNDTAGAP